MYFLCVSQRVNGCIMIYMPRMQSRVVPSPLSPPLFDPAPFGHSVSMEGRKFNRISTEIADISWGVKWFYYIITCRERHCFEITIPFPFRSPFFAVLVFSSCTPHFPPKRNPCSRYIAYFPALRCMSTFNYGHVLSAECCKCRTHEHTCHQYIQGKGTHTHKGLVASTVATSWFRIIGVIGLHLKPI